MKKRIIRLLVCVLAMCMLCGCGDPSRTMQELIASSTRDSAPSFDKIEYERPDMEKFENDVEMLKMALDEDDFDKVADYIDRCYEYFYNFDTMYTIANIRSCTDLNDQFYAEEYAWCGSNYPTVQQLMDEVYYACGASSMAERIEEELLWEGFAQEYAPGESSELNEEVVALMEKESELLSRYRSLTASPDVEFKEGAEADYGDALSELQETDNRDDLLSYYDKYNEEFADIYIELVKTRNAMAQALGFESYEQMQYYYFFERDYSPEQAGRYMADIKQYMVPFYKEYMASKPYENIIYTRCDEEKLISVLDTATENMGGTIESAFDFMVDKKLYDISFSADKAPMSFQTYLSDYESPFLFVNPVGDTEDIITFSHEFGHFLDAYENFNAYETVDVSETFSQAMEYLMLFYYGDALSDEQWENLVAIKLMDTLEMYVQQASFAEFESTVYSTDPELLNAEFLNNLSLQLAKDYGYCNEENEEYFAKSWCDIVHFFEMPFYIITYPVSNDAAMQIFELELAESGKGLEKYLEMLPREYGSFMETVTGGGLQSPFEKGRIQKVVQDMSLMLDYSDMAA